MLLFLFFMKLFGSKNNCILNAFPPVRIHLSPRMFNISKTNWFFQKMAQGFFIFLFVKKSSWVCKYFIFVKKYTNIQLFYVHQKTVKVSFLKLMNHDIVIWGNITIFDIAKSIKVASRVQVWKKSILSKYDKFGYSVI